MSAEDLFFDAHNAFLITNYHKCQSILQQIKTKDVELQKHIDCLTYRAYIGQKKFAIVFDEIKESTDIVELKLIRLLALYLSDPHKKDFIIDKMETTITKSVAALDNLAFIIVATIYLNMDMPEAALKHLHNASDIRCDLIAVQCLIKMNRFDLARKIVGRMQTADEDALPSQLAAALYYLTQGGEKLQEALHTYQDLQEKYGANPMLLNGQALSYIGMNKWEEAEPLIQEAMDLDENNVDTIINSIAVAQHTGKTQDVISRYILQLQELKRDNILTESYTRKEMEFDQLAAQYAPAVM